MRAHFALDTGSRPTRFRSRSTARAAVLLARLISRLPPYRIRGLLLWLRSGATPVEYRRAETARASVVSVSALCAGEGCVVRSLAVCLLCRLQGTWPTWRSGIRTAPFVAHAWVEADGRMVGEPYPEDYFIVTLSVPPEQSEQSNRPDQPDTAEQTVPPEQPGEPQQPGQPEQPGEDG